MAPLGCLPGPDARGSARSLQGGGQEPGPVILTCVALYVHVWLHMEQGWLCATQAPYL